MNLFDNILNPQARQAFSQTGNAIGQAFKPLTQFGQQVSQPISQVGTGFAQGLNQATQGFVQPIKQEYQYQKSVSDYYKPYREQISQLGLTVDDINEIPEDKRDIILSGLKEIGVQIPGLEEQQQAQVQQMNDWYANKSYFGDQRPEEGFFEQAGKGLVRGPLTFAQNVVAQPENIAQGSLNLLDQTLGEGALNPLLNVIGKGIKGDKYNPLPTWYNDVPSQNKWTENVASNIIGAGKEAITTDKTYEQARQELAQQQYMAGKDQGIGGSLANIAGGTVGSAFNILAPWVSAGFSTASEMPGTQYITQGLGALTQAPIDYFTNKAGGTQETAEQIGTVTNFALPLGRNKIAGMKPTSTPGKILQKSAVATADAITNPFGTAKNLGVSVFSKTPRAVEDIAGNILQPYKGMTENIDDATNGLRRVVQETGIKTSTYDGLLAKIRETKEKYGKMLSDSLGQITSSSRSRLFDTALTQLAQIYEGVSSTKFQAVQKRINELGKKNITSGLTPAEKNEVKILHTQANNLFNEKGQQTGGFSSDDLRALRQDMVKEINSEAVVAGVTNIAEINKAYGEIASAEILADNQLANLRSYKGRTPPPSTMQKVANLIVDFPIIKQVFSDPSRAVIFALTKNLRGDKINPIEVQKRLPEFLRELQKAGAKKGELQKIEQIMINMTKYLPARSSAKIPLTPTESDMAMINQSNLSTKNTKYGTSDSNIPPSAPSSRQLKVKAPKTTPKSPTTPPKQETPIVVPKTVKKPAEGQMKLDIGDTIETKDVKKPILDEITDERVGEKDISSFEIKTTDGGRSFYLDKTKLSDQAPKANTPIIKEETKSPTPETPVVPKAEVAPVKEEVTPVAKSPETTIAKYQQLGDMQREAPEQAWSESQKTTLSGIHNQNVMHSNDLLHRIYTLGRVQFDSVSDKINKIYDDLKDPENYKKIVDEQTQSNLDYNKAQGKDVTNALIDEANGLAKVAEEHSKLPVYNEMQKTIQDMTIALANKDYTTASNNITKLKGWLDKGEDFFSQKAFETPVKAVLEKGEFKGAPLEGKMKDEITKGLDNLKKTKKSLEKKLGNSTPLSSSPKPISSEGEKKTVKTPQKLLKKEDSGIL